MPQFLYAEALAFYEIIETKRVLVVCRPLINVQMCLRACEGVWSQTILVLEALTLCNLIGIWSQNHSKAYILRKHPGLLMLSAEQTEQDPHDEVEGNSQVVEPDT